MPENNPSPPKPDDNGHPAAATATAAGSPAAVPIAQPPPLDDREARSPVRIWEALLLLGGFSLTQVAFGLAVAVAAKWLLEPGSLQDVGMVAIPVSLVSSHLLGWGCIYWLVALRHRRPFLQGLALTNFRGSAAAWGFIGGMVLQVGVAVLTWIFPPGRDFSSPIVEFIQHGAWAAALLFVMAVVMAPPLEEVLFRGLLLPALRRRYRFAFSALVVTVLFTALHTSQTGTYLPPLAGIALCGYLLAWLRESSGSLWPSIAFHAGFNFAAFLPVLPLVATL